MNALQNKRMSFITFSVTTADLTCGIITSDFQRPALFPRCDSCSALATLMGSLRSLAEDVTAVTGGAEAPRIP